MGGTAEQADGANCHNTLTVCSLYYFADSLLAAFVGGVTLSDLRDQPGHPGQHSKETLVHRLTCLAILGMSLALAGCGGGGSSSGGGSAQVGVFVTDSFRDDYDHVWATIFRVDLVDISNNVVNVFNDANGVVIDLKTLRDANGQRFAFLSETSIPAGTYTQAKVTLAPNLNLIAKGQTTGTTLQLDASIPRDSLNNAVVTFNLPAPRPINGSDDVVVDFDLANFKVQLGKIVPSLKEGGKTGLGDRNRHEENEYEGDVSALSGSAPTFTFTLTRGGRSVTVTMTVDTTIFNANQAPSPTLANGKHVHVRGVFDTTANSLVANSIKIQSAQDVNHPEIKGTPSNINATLNTFDVTASKAHGMMPNRTTIHVITNTNTALRGDSGVLLDATTFYTQLATATSVEVEGTYDAPSSTITATRAKVDVEHHGQHGSEQAEVKGTPTTLQAAAGTFAVNPVAEFEGFTYSGTGGVNVTTSGTTQFHTKNGDTLTKTAFFTALANATSVKVDGAYSNGTLAATSARIQ
jgi:hypothetical protein